MNNQIKNPKTEVPKGMQLNDKDYLNSLLSCLKELAKNYCLATTESSNETLYKHHIEAFLSISTLQREAYELMFRKGWYTLEKSDSNKIQTKYQTLNQELSDLKTSN